MLASGGAELTVRVWRCPDQKVCEIKEKMTCEFLALDFSRDCTLARIWHSLAIFALFKFWTRAHAAGGCVERQVVFGLERDQW